MNEKYRVLLLGDSISIQYRESVKEKCNDFAEFYYPKENGRFAAYTFRCLYDWQNEYNFPQNIDLVYWNNGLWDVVRIFGDNPQTGINEYADMIGRLFNRLRYMFPTSKIVFGLTTPVDESAYGQDFNRNNKDICEYNKCAEEVIRKLGGGD